MTQRRRCCIAVAAAVVVVNACSAGRGAPAGSARPESPGPASPAPAPAAGRWVVAADASLDPIRRAAVQAAQDLGRSITERLRLPRDITVRFDDCDASETTWSRAESQVLLCDGTVRDAAEALGHVLPVAGALVAGDPTPALVSVTRFLLARQLGSAVVDLFAPGSARSAAPPAVDEPDEFAALFLLGDPELGGDVSTAAHVLPWIRTPTDSSVTARALRQARADALLCLSRSAGIEPGPGCDDRLKAKLAWWERRLGIVRLK